MMADVRQIMLRHDPGTLSSGGTDVSATLGVDNIRLRAAPIPGDTTMMAWSMPRTMSCGRPLTAPLDTTPPAAMATSSLTLRTTPCGATPQVRPSVGDPEPSGILIVLSILVQLPFVRRCVETTCAKRVPATA